MGITGSWDTQITRRTLLRTGGSAAAGIALLSHAQVAAARPPFADQPFGLGVASGDPTPSGIVIWTRLAPAPLESGGGLPDQLYGVRYELAADEHFRRIVHRGAAAARPDEAHCVHAEIGGLRPATNYWYRFKWGPAVSPVGRTRTAPPAWATPAAMRFAFVSCQNYTNGFYPAYADIAGQDDLELVVHLGDYIYEGPGLGATRVRDHLPAHELFSLDDYRTRHAQYRTDPALQAAHAAHPFLMTWDDHEFKDNYADLDLEPDQPLETVAARRAAAYLAYWEHAPLSRSRKPVGKDMNLYRRARWGKLATFHVLDTRQHRSDQIVQCAVTERDPSGYCPGALDPARGILGGEQRDWLREGLGTSGTSWNVLANQVGFAPVDRDSSLLQRQFNVDPWDGYVAERQLVLDFLAKRGLMNTVVITGDAHEHSVRNVPRDFAALDGPPIATEFVGTSISSEGDPTTPRSTFGGDPNNPQVLFVNNQRGYVRVGLTPELWTNECRVVATVRAPSSAASTAATFVVENGKPGAVLAGASASPQ
jgi:alkaline phosphatase D